MTLNEAIRKTFPGVYVHISESGGTLFVQHMVVTEVAKSKSLLNTTSKIGRLLVQYADTRQMPAVITAQRVEGFDTDNSKLARMYSRFDFIPCTILGEDAMIRYPVDPEDPNSYGPEDYDDGISA